jgi:hypothetical protein
VGACQWKSFTEECLDQTTSVAFGQPACFERSLIARTGTAAHGAAKSVWLRFAARSVAQYMCCSGVHVKKKCLSGKPGIKLSITSIKR